VVGLSLPPDFCPLLLRQPKHQVASARRIPLTSSSSTWEYPVGFSVSTKYFVVTLAAVSLTRLPSPS
jgi:hypothetical protein